MPEASAPTLENPARKPLPTRTETDRSAEDATRHQALQTLTEVGLFASVSQLDTYHGRVGNGETFAVKTGVKNGKGDSPKKM